MRDCTYEDQAHCVYEMRRDVRTEFRDVRMNRPVIKHLWDFIAAAADEFDTGVYINPGEKAKKRRGRKRKTDHDDEEEVVTKPEKKTRRAR